MPALIPLFLAGVTGGLLGFSFGGGAKGIADFIKYATIAFLAYLAFKAVT